MRPAVVVILKIRGQHSAQENPLESGHACLRGRFTSGTMAPWEFERDGEVVRVDPTGPLLVRVGAATDLAVEAAIAGTGIIYLFEDWLRRHLDRGILEPVLEPWWQRFPGPFLYYPGRRLVPAPLRRSSPSSRLRLTKPDICHHARPAIFAISAPDALSAPSSV